jgi:hypothetical protein
VQNNPTTFGDPDGHENEGPPVNSSGAGAWPVRRCSLCPIPDSAQVTDANLAVQNASLANLAAQNNGTDKPNTNSSSSNSDSGVGKSVTKGYKWYKFITGWFNKGMEAKKLKDEMQSDRQIRDIAAGAVMSISPRTPAQFGEIWQLEEQNLLLDTGRQIGKIMGEVPNIPGEDKFGEAVFNAYGKQRDANNNRIDTLLQEAAASLTPQ